MALTKKECLQFEKIAETEITKILGTPEVGPLGNASWFFPYGDGGHVSIHLLRSKKKISERGYTSPWLACRYTNAANRDASGYTKPKAEIDWPSGFTYPSGKQNLHVSKGDNFALLIATHLRRLARADSAEHDAFGCIPFEVDA